VITGDIKNIQAQLTALKGEPGLSSQTSQLQASVSQVESAAKTMAASPSVSAAQGVVKALTGLKSTAKPMVGQMKAACP
jgi:hypothetical protein